MAIRPLNSVGGFSVGEVPVTIVYANGDITTLNLSANANVLFTGPNVSLGNVSNLHILGGNAGEFLKTDGTGNLSFQSIDVSSLSNGTSNITVLQNGNILLSVGGTSNVGVFTSTGLNVDGYINSTGNITSGNANVGNLAVANYFTGTLTTNAQPNITSVGTLSNLAVTGNISSGNASLGNLASATYLSGTLTTQAQPNITSLGVLNELIVANTILADGYSARTGSDLTISVLGQNANVIITPNGTGVTDFSGKPIANASTITATGNITGGNLISNGAVIGNIDVGNLDVSGNLVAETISANGNVSGANINGNLHGNLFLTGSNTEVLFNDDGIASSNSGFTFNKTNGTIVVSGNANVGNLFSNANVTANSFVLTNNVQSISGGITITAAGLNSSVNLFANGTGTINVGNFNISNVGGPTNARDAATKEYVDNAVSAALTIHTAVRVETPSALTASYTQGGTTPTITTISGGNVLTTSTTHNLSIDDMIVFDNSFNGITAGTPYFVYTIPASNQITISASYNGPELTGLTNGTSLTETSRANSGVGATLTNSGSQAALVIDNVTLSVGNRVLVYQQANQAHNGIYTVTDTGSGSSNWILTRATDSDKYAPNSTTGMSYGDYFFVQEGDTGAGESYVNNTLGIIIIGTTNITFAEFSDTQVYTAGTGLTLDGTEFSIANTTVTAGTYGNGDVIAQFTVNSQGQLTAASNVAVTANAANLTGTELNPNIVTSNLTSVGTLANLTVTGNLSSGNASLGNLATANYITITGNLTSGNASLGNLASANYLTGTLTTGAQPNVTSVGTLANLDVTGNITAGGFVGNVYGDVFGNISGNITVTGGNTQVLFNDDGLANALPGFTFDKTSNLVTISGNANVGGILTDNYYYANGSPLDFQQPAGSNTQLQYNDNNDFGASANLTFDSATNILTVNGTANIGTIQTSTIDLGNTLATWSTQTTISTGANQTIATYQVTSTDITGFEFFVKGVDSTGAKYSVAKIVAVTNGTTVDYSTFATINLNGSTGTLAVNIVTSGPNSNVALQVTPASSNSTVWTTQYRLI